MGIPAENMTFMDIHPLRLMKSSLCFLLVMAPATSIFAQGQIVFGNSLPATQWGLGVRAPVYEPDPNDPFTAKQGNSSTGFPPGTTTYAGMLLAGTGYTAALFTLADTTYVEIARTPFRTGTASGFWFTTVVTDPNHPAGSTVTAVVRAWDNKGGSVTNWDQALADSTTPVGQSMPFTISQLGGAPNTPPGIYGLRSFNLYRPGGAFIITQPQDVIVPAGASAQMDVEVVSDVGQPSFQWQRNGVDIPGATDATLSFTNIQYADTGDYSVIVTAPSVTLNSRVARLIVQPKIADIEHFYIPEWGADAVRLSYDSTPSRPVRVEVRSSILDAWINMGQYVNPNVRSFFFDIGPTNDMRFYRLSIDP